MEERIEQMTANHEDKMEELKEGLADMQHSKGETEMLLQRYKEKTEQLMG